MSDETVIDYRYTGTEADHTHAYLWERICSIMLTQFGKRVFDLGCGNGAFVRHLQRQGYEVLGVDPSEEGVQHSRVADPASTLEVGSAYEPLSKRYGLFPMVVSLEVVEHVYYPKKYARSVADLLEPGGIALISTPYHGYLKNVALALSGKLDSHFTALWDHGHIKFWSVKTITALFEEQGLIPIKVLKVGRIPIFAKSMIIVFQKQ